MSRKSNSSLAGLVAVITGATSGVGKNIALALSEQGVQLALIGRRKEALDEVAGECRESTSRVLCYQADLTSEPAIVEASQEILSDFGDVDIVVHSAGVIALSDFDRASTGDFDLLYQSNVRAPFILTRQLLPSLATRKGQIIFVNSTIGLVGAGGVAQYAATKQALRGLAESLREEVNPHGIKVSSLFLGRTATPMQAKVHRWEGKKYIPDSLIQPKQVASLVVSTLKIGPEVEITDIKMRPMMKQNITN